MLLQGLVLCWLINSVISFFINLLLLSPSSSSSLMRTGILVSSAFNLQLIKQKPTDKKRNNLSCGIVGNHVTWWKQQLLPAESYSIISLFAYSPSSWSGDIFESTWYVYTLKWNKLESLQHVTRKQRSPPDDRRCSSSPQNWAAAAAAAACDLPVVNNGEASQQGPACSLKSPILSEPDCLSK